jgi:hypothetical protein
MLMESATFNGYLWLEEKPVSRFITGENLPPLITSCAVTRNIEGCNVGSITGPSFSTTPAVSSEVEFENTTNQGVVADDCEVTSVMYVDVASGTCPIHVTRTWTITDNCGNTASCQQNIYVDDN